MFCAFWDYSNLKQKDTNNTKGQNLPKSNKTEIKILSIPGLA